MPTMLVGWKGPKIGGRRVHPLTDAFIKGRGKFKKISGKYVDKTDKPKAMCHLGAMYWGVYQSPIDDAHPVWQLKNDFPEISDHLVEIPCEHRFPTESTLDETGDQGHISSILIHLNDQHDGRSGWTDEKVASWLESVLSKPTSNNVASQG